jgi:RimJ/RimL family protein N-acetyltransferase/ADP-ribose pyrophosphatase YjhB (NUDIX family)
MLIRSFEIDRDYEHISNWISDERTHAMWCANLIPYPLEKESLRSFLSDISVRFDDKAYVATDDEGHVVGFYCYSLNHETHEGILKFVMVDASVRGKGIGKEMIRLAVRNAFSDPEAQAVQLNVFPENERAKKCYEGAGFTERITTPDAFRYKDESWGRCNMIQNREELFELQDTEWPFEYTDHDRRIARAIVYDDDGYFYFVRAERDDDFGRATLIETSGGGVEADEDLNSAIKRELKEELGAEVEIVCKIGVVSDYYNLIHRHNVNNYFLCRVVSFGDKHLTQDEIDDFHLSTLKLTYEEAVAEYEKRRDTKLGRLIANRELPILRKARMLI